LAQALKLLMMMKQDSLKYETYHKHCYPKRKYFELSESRPI
jgi:hypothetical protein